MRIIDSQVHVWAAHTAERPWADVSVGTNHGSEYLPAALLADMAAVGVEAAVLVPPGAWEGFRNDLALAAAAERPDRFAVMVNIDPAAAAAAQTLERHLADPRVRGVRLDFWGDSPRALAFRRRELDWVWRRMIESDRPVAVLVPGLLDDIADLAARFPDLRIALCHLAMTTPGERPGEVVEHLTRLSELARFPNLSVKASGLPALSALPFPFPDIHDPVLQVIDAFGPERVFWGSDHTRVTARTGQSYADCVRLFTEALRPRLDDASLAAIMGESLSRWLAWDPGGCSRSSRT
jgi:predicted TIM-barrel fold metal-dependent hydrolase